MAVLSQAAYEAKYNSAGSGNFPDNSTQLITASKVREFGKDTSDTFFAVGGIVGYKTSLTVASAAIRGCGTAAAQILAAAGAGKYHAIQKIVASYKAGATAFNFTSELVFKSVGGDVQFLISGDLNSLTSANFDLIKQGQKQVTNVAYVLTTADGSNATVGNGDLDITIYYTIEDINT